MLILPLLLQSLPADIGIAELAQQTRRWRWLGDVFLEARLYGLYH